jgi:hypothetical protein
MAAAIRRRLGVAVATTLIGGFAIAATAAPKRFSEDDVAAAVKDIIAERSKDGVFHFNDAATGDELSLVFDGIRVVRGLPTYGWFPNVNFHDAEEPRKKYALDFWLKPDGDRLKLMVVRIHKAPRPDGSSWMSITRAPLPWWWLPTIERASAVADLPAWQVMGAVHSRIVEAKRGDGVVPAGTNGKPLALELIDIVQPVGRSKADGRYFACAQFRIPGSRLATFAAYYWLEPKSGSVTLGSLKPESTGPTEAIKAATEPRCEVGGISFDIVD